MIYAVSTLHVSPLAGGQEEEREEREREKERPMANARGAALTPIPRHF